MARDRLVSVPDETETLYLLAVASRYSGDLNEAGSALDRLLDIKPDYGRAYQELGHLLRQAGDDGEAAAAYRRAVHYNPALVAAWRELGRIQNRTGDLKGAEISDSQVVTLESFAPPLVAVQSFLHEGRLGKAEELVRAILNADPANVEGMRLLAAIGVAMKVLDDAEFLLESALEFEPDNLRVKVDYCDVLHKRQKFDRALATAEELTAKDPDNPVFLTLRGNALMGVGRFEDAVEAYQTVLRQAPDAETVCLSMGHALKTIGRQDEAVDAYQRAYRARSDFGDAYWSLANLKTYRFSASEVNSMERAAASPRVMPDDRIHFEFALGKAYEDRGAFGLAFDHYSRANDLRRKKNRYNPDHFDSEVRSAIENCTIDLFVGSETVGNTARDPIFVLGLPRAGSTLIEQILASHSLVDGTAELPTILSLVNGLKETDQSGWKAYHPYLSELNIEERLRLGNAYLEGAALFRGEQPYFVDKMPNNFRHIGFIKLILPNAKIIDARRHPLSCGFSVFKQLFAEGQEFSYGLDSIGRYYRGYWQMMDHWDAVLPGSVLRVCYENVVEDTEAQVRRILEYCGLPFEQQCVDFHKTDRAVRTASSEQVRQPIFRSGIDQWSNFDKYLDPLRDALGECLSIYDEDRQKYR